MKRMTRTRRLTPMDLTPALRTYLLVGWAITGDQPTPEEAAAAWAEHGDALTAYWQSDPAAWFAAGNRRHIYNDPPEGPGAVPWYAGQAQEHDR
jgi:hypothetical protein